MKKLLVLIVAAMLAVTGVAATGCNKGEKEILVVMRESGSGTREAFEKVVKKDGVSLEKISKGETVEYSFVTNRQELPKTSDVITSVQSNENAIGYVSLASVSSDVKALKVEGVEANVANVQSGSYKIQRPFLLLTRADEVMTDAARDFFNFCMSSDVLDTIDEEGLIQDPNRTPAAYAAAGSLGGTINVTGSTSMTDVMTKLIAQYKLQQPNLTINPTYPGSGGGRTAVEQDATGATIGLASSSSPKSAYTENTLCLDAVAVIVNPANEMTDITILNLFDIYTGTIKKFSEIK
ncbi:MAG: hypothetical protein DBX59_03405 [Bacillota bacterium]|nr:MAG: hypothetical protein DBX59_03405 [Bacillota bacterium]